MTDLMSKKILFFLGQLFDGLEAIHSLADSCQQSTLTKGLAFVLETLILDEGVDIVKHVFFGLANKGISQLG